MNNPQALRETGRMNKSPMNEFDPESAIIDAELLVKYRMLNRAIETLERAIDNAPRHLGLREKLREILIDAGRRDQAAQICLALASLHISVGDMERAGERLLEAKRLDPRVSVTGQLRDLRQASVPPVAPAPAPPPAQEKPATANLKLLSGHLGEISLFDIIQILENSRLNGVLRIKSGAATGEIYLSDGLVADAKVEGEVGLAGMRRVTDVTDGTFDFTKTADTYARVIAATSNTALILDLLREKDEEAFGLNTGDLA